MFISKLIMQLGERVNSLLKKCIVLKNIGLFESGAPNPVEFKKVTLIYGENGRGKSTLAETLYSCARGDVTGIEVNRTINSSAEPEVTLLFTDGGASKNVRYSNGAWSDQMENIAVFDDQFVERNVYSGYEVRPEQRQSLYEFVLGDQAVKLQKKLDSLLEEGKNTVSEMREVEKRIECHSGKLSLADFTQLPAAKDADQSLTAIRKKMNAANSKKALLARREPATIDSIDFNVDNFFGILHKSLPDVHACVEQRLSQYFSEHDHGFEQWVSNGQAFIKDGKCPFCGRSMTGLEIMECYKTYFNQAYTELKRLVATLEKGVEYKLADQKIDLLDQLVQANTGYIVMWADQMDIAAPPFDIAIFRGKVAQVRECALMLANKKQQVLLDTVGDASEHVLLKQGISDINKLINEYNVKVKNVVLQIKLYKDSLVKENIGDLQKQEQNILTAITRHSPDVVLLIERRKKLLEKKKTLDKNKQGTREELDQLMSVVFSQYQERINNLLTKFGANFSIEKMSSTFQGNGSPRTEYRLSLRQSTIPLGGRNDNTPNFGSVLSEGDKRTLAFAFFVAKIEGEPVSLENRILVFDDPICSLDRNRRSQTMEVITSFADKCEQVVVLSHDAYFIRDLRDKISKVESCKTDYCILEVKRSGRENSVLVNGCPIDNTCASEYYKNYSIVRDHLEGTYPGELRNVAKAIRPLMEGFYHRRFPGLLPKNTMFGKIIEDIKAVQQGDHPLKKQQANLEQLTHINEYAKQFHHDTNQSCDSVMVVDGELKCYAAEALDLIYHG